MKLSEKEKAAHRAAFQTMSLPEKLDHIYTYYKWPILLGIIALIILGSVVQRQLTKKEPLLYLALANVEVGEDLEDSLTGGFLRAVGADPRRQEVSLYRGLYLSDDSDTVNHQYAYASHIRVMGAVNAKKLDVMLMNREAYDLLSGSGYLLALTDLPDGVDASLRERIAPYITANDVILSDNAIEWELGEAESHEVVTETVENAIALNSLPLFENAGFDEPVYLGIAVNSPRLTECAQYTAYLFS